MFSHRESVFILFITYLYMSLFKVNIPETGLISNALQLLQPRRQPQPSQKTIINYVYVYYKIPT